MAMIIRILVHSEESIVFGVTCRFGIVICRAHHSPGARMTVERRFRISHAEFGRVGDRHRYNLSRRFALRLRARRRLASNRGFHGVTWRGKKKEGANARRSLVRSPSRSLCSGRNHGGKKHLPLELERERESRGRHADVKRNSGATIVAHCRGRDI